MPIGHRAGPELVFRDDRGEQRVPHRRVEDVFDVGPVNAEDGPHPRIDESRDEEVGHRHGRPSRIVIGHKPAYRVQTLHSPAPNSGAAPADSPVSVTGPTQCELA